MMSPGRLFDFLYIRTCTCIWCPDSDMGKSLNLRVSHAPFLLHLTRFYLMYFSFTMKSRSDVVYIDLVLKWNIAISCASPITATRRSHRHLMSLLVLLHDIPSKVVPRGNFIGVQTSGRTRTSALLLCPHVQRPATAAHVASGIPYGYMSICHPPCATGASIVTTPQWYLRSHRARCLRTGAGSC